MDSALRPRFDCVLSDAEHSSINTNEADAVRSAETTKSIYVLCWTEAHSYPNAGQPN